MFIEHIGALIYRSLWSEMLDDRKFYFAIKPEESQAPAPAQGGPFRNMQLRKWLPIGPAEAIVMDNDHPFVGEQSPRIELDASTPHGIRQSGFSLVKGKKYSGHIWLRATPGVKVKLSLAWGQGANDRKTVVFPALSTTYKELPFTFTSEAATDAGAVEITGTGNGNVHIGAVSLMPADNLDGFRPEDRVTEAVALRLLAAARRELHFRFQLVSLGWGTRPAAAGFRLRVECHADQRCRHG